MIPATLPEVLRRVIYGWIGLIIVLTLVCQILKGGP